MTSTEARDIAVTMLAHAKMALDPKTKIENAAHEIQDVVQKRARNSFWSGISIGIGATLIAAIIFGLFLRWV